MPAAVVVGATLVGAYASKRAGDQAAAGAKKGLEQSGALAAQSRNDALNLYNQSRTAGQRGLASAFNFYKDAAQSKYQPFIQGNVAAQGAIGQGAAQANNAILGLPVDMSFAQPQQINPDLSMLRNAKLPEMTGEYLAGEKSQMAGTGGGLMGGLAQNAWLSWLLKDMGVTND